MPIGRERPFEAPALIHRIGGACGLSHVRSFTRWRTEFRVRPPRVGRVGPRDAALRSAQSLPVRWACSRRSRRPRRCLVPPAGGRSNRHPTVPGSSPGTVADAAATSGPRAFGMDDRTFHQNARYSCRERLTTRDVEAPTLATCGASILGERQRRAQRTPTSCGRRYRARGYSAWCWLCASCRHRLVETRSTRYR